MSAQPNSYDVFPYPSFPLHLTHPDHLATIATLLRLTPALPDRCRVLELGCASGGNLIPMAASLPESRFIGVDLSCVQIAEGQSSVNALGLTNIDLRHMSILDVDETFGQFDYIICHGVFSWVPPPVQDKILDLCAHLLSPNGVGFVSYNTLPGWCMRGMLRDMVKFHAQRAGDVEPRDRVAKAKGLLEFLASSVTSDNNPYGLFLQHQLKLFRQQSDSYLFHEHLEETNLPIYFLDFCDRLAQRRLRYLGEAEFNVMVASSSFSTEVLSQLEEIAPDLLEREQYMDFLRNRTFRQTLICHAERRPAYDVQPDKIEQFHICSPIQPVNRVDLATEEPDSYRSPEGLLLSVSSPLVKVGMVILSENWPRTISFDRLLNLSRERLASFQPARDTPFVEDRHQLAKALLAAYASAGNELVEFHILPSLSSSGVSPRPIASLVARVQARTTRQVCNLRHQLVNLTPFDAHLLPLLDGTRNRQSLIARMVELVERGDMTISENDAPIINPRRIAAIIEEVLDRQLPKLAISALLVDAKDSEVPNEI